MTKEREPKRFSFELTRAELLGPDQQKEIGDKKEGLVAIEKIVRSPPDTKLHYIGKNGIVKFIKDIGEGKT